ncbi:MAG: TetR/AcrR family transcriptional regulator [Bryobacterales bacterium]
MPTSQQEAKVGRPRDPEIDRAILGATLRHMADEGYSAMSIAAIAESAGVTKPALYRRWKSKADLATAALLQLQTEEPTPQTGDLEQDLRKALENFQRNLFRPNGMAMIGMLLSEEKRAPELIALFRERITRRRRQIVRSILEAGAARGEIPREADLDVAVNLLIGSFYAKYIADAKAPRNWPERVVRLVLAALRLGSDS